ncbi:glycoside hydrolase family 25 protein [Flavisolibacter nicotianae]|uniref:glycoside hydrolase family 25 protein n=1 Tax=Flavisolibacter nicotianae TaxID=2364882 RepID=UPI000EB1A6E1|nr:GH25 family lysozyme [Flavisolibacter nicotianae]
MVNKTLFLLLLLFIVGSAVAQKKMKSSKPLTEDTNSKAFLYYAVMDVKHASSDTVCLENNVYLYINRQDNGLYFKKYDKLYPVPKKYYSDITTFIFQSALANDPYGILERMAQMNGLLKNSKIGIDVASHQSPTGQPIDWHKVKADTANAPISFIIMRSIRGYDNSYDPRFLTHYTQASATGFPIGFYHNFVLNRSHRPDYLKHAEEQAYKFVESFKNKKVAFKPILDIEVHEKYAVGKDFSPDEIRKATKVFIDFVERELKTDVIIYTFESFYYTNLKGYFDDRYVWIARYPHGADFGKQGTYPGSKNPFLGISYDFVNQRFDYRLKNNSIGWQFSENGIVKGTHNDVDLSIILNKDYEKWLWK